MFFFSEQSIQCVEYRQSETNDCIALESAEFYISIRVLDYKKQYNQYAIRHVFSLHSVERTTNARCI